MSSPADFRDSCSRLSSEKFSEINGANRIIRALIEALKRRTVRVEKIESFRENKLLLNIRERQLDWLRGK